MLIQTLIDRKNNVHNFNNIGSSGEEINLEVDVEKVTNNTNEPTGSDFEENKNKNIIKIETGNVKFI